MRNLRTRKMQRSFAAAPLALAASIGIANAATYNVLGTFSDTASLTGTIGVDNGELLSVNLNGGNALPGDKAVNFFGTLCAFNRVALRHSLRTHIYYPRRL
jgi:hypothetical protein